jgi:hypothetical protein
MAYAMGYSSIAASRLDFVSEEQLFYRQEQIANKGLEIHTDAPRRKHFGPS